MRTAQQKIDAIGALDGALAEWISIERGVGYTDEQLVARFDAAMNASDGTTPDFSGGRVIVERLGAEGWELTHEPAKGGCFGFDCKPNRIEALKAAEARASRFDAKIFVQIED